MPHEAPSRQPTAAQQPTPHEAPSPQPAPHQPGRTTDGWWSTPASAAPGLSASAPDVLPGESDAAAAWLSAPPAQSVRSDAVASRAADLPAPTADIAPQQLPPADWAGFAPPPLAPSPTAATPPPIDASRSRRVPVEIDDEFLPAAGPGRPPYEPRHDTSALPRPSGQDASAPVDSQTVSTQVPVNDAAHVATEIARPEPLSLDQAAVPVWAVRAPPPVQPTASSGPQFISDLSLDPMSLRRHATLRAGASAVTADEDGLRLRTWFKRSELAWRDIHGFEAHHDTGDRSAPGGGHLVALTAMGSVELPGTRRLLGELRYAHALLDAYRIRAQRIANR
jgi:hypothetical protein